MFEDLKHKTKKGIYWTFFNQLARNGLGFIVGIVMARLLSPSDYGITALPAIFTSIGYILMDSGFPAALIRKSEINKDDLTTAFIYNEIIGVLFYLVFFVGAPYIADFYNTPILTSLIRVTTLSFLWIPFTSPQSILLKRNLEFKKAAYISFWSSLLGAIAGVFCAVLGFGLWSLVVMGTFQSICNCILMAIVVKWVPNGQWSKASFQYLWRFGNKLIATYIINSLYSNLTPMIIGKFFSPAQLGIYNRANNYANLPAQQGNNVIQSVTFPVLCKLQYDKDKVSLGYRKMVKVTAFVVFPVMMLLAALARPFIILLITEKWADCIILLRLICFSTMLFPIHSISLNLLQTMGRTDLFLKNEIIKKSLALLAMACSLPFGLIAFVSVGIAISFIELTINIFYVKKVINVGLYELIIDILPLYLSSIFVFVIVYLVCSQIAGLYFQLIIGISLGITIYFSIAYILKFDELNDLKYMIKRNK